MEQDFLKLELESVVQQVCQQIQAAADLLLKQEKEAQKQNSEVAKSSKSPSLQPSCRSQTEAKSKVVAFLMACGTACALIAHQIEREVGRTASIVVPGPKIAM